MCFSENTRTRGNGDIPPGEPASERASPILTSSTSRQRSEFFGWEEPGEVEGKMHNKRFSKSTSTAEGFLRGAFKMWTREIAREAGRLVINNVRENRGEYIKSFSWERLEIILPSGICNNTVAPASRDFSRFDR